MLDGDVAETLKEQIGEIEYDKLLQSKPQEEKNEIVKAEENTLLEKMRQGASHSERMEQQKKIVKLAGSGEKLDKMRHTSIDLNGNIKYSGGVNMDIAKGSIRQMSNSEIMKQSDSFFSEVGHLVGKSATKEMGKYGQTEKIYNMQNKITTELAATGPNPSDLSPSGVKRKDLEEREKATENQL